MSTVICKCRSHYEDTIFFWVFRKVAFLFMFHEGGCGASMMKLRNLPPTSPPLFPGKGATKLGSFPQGATRCVSGGWDSVFYPYSRVKFTVAKDGRLSPLLERGIQCYIRRKLSTGSGVRAVDSWFPNLVLGGKVNTGNSFPL